MATVKTLVMQAREYFYAENYLDLETIMDSLREKSPTRAATLRVEFEDMIAERALLDDMGDIHGY